MQSGKLNNTRCDDLGKLMKQSSFKVKKPAEGGGGGRMILREQSTISNRS